MLGSVTTDRNRVRQSGSTGVATTPAVRNTRSASDTFSLRPSSRLSRSGTFSATRSITFILSASDADRLTAPRTARSAHSALRSRICARLRMYAEASLTCLRVIVLEVPPASPFPVLPAFPSVFPSALPSSSCAPPPGAPMATGVAAPRLVAGAIAAMWLA